ncbi:metallophosphoesterase [Lentibacillus cibarius]|uniref:Phosphoesterase n=1 Tax=Lentibacillus cibarius TaxID=2583219 RepID=A0A549YLX1_9BACI|nr:metallophosphoesterase [Lentibacillus cibarius]TRM12882.1 metallophosphoesterase [Lentibacillus cibarius]
MPEVVIVSDSHGSTDELKIIKERHSPEYMIHCGDSELDMDAPELDGFVKVAGNCDVDVRFPEEQTSQIGDLYFFIAHGHLHQVKSNPLAIAYRAQELKAQVVCFGHTHIAGAKKVGQQLLINPGSVLLPRRRTEKTYALMNWDTLDDVRVDFYTVEGNHLDELSLRTSLT